MNASSLGPPVGVLLPDTGRQYVGSRELGDAVSGEQLMTWLCVCQGRLVCRYV
jgi:hypothetical protein